MRWCRDPGETFWALYGQGMQDQAHQHGINLAIHPVLNWAETQVEVENCLRQPHLDALSASARKLISSQL
jgi:hypothetical protein